MNKVTKNQIRQLHRENRRFPETLIELPFDSWPLALRMAPPSKAPKRAFRSRLFLVQVFAAGEGASARLSVCRTDFDTQTQRWRQNIGWDDLQRLKSEAGYGDAWAIEIFPPDNGVVNVANMRHLWVIPEAPAFAWNKETVNG